MPRISTLFDPGTAKIEEDAWICSGPYVGVVDGVSGLYTPDQGPRKFTGGLSGGQMIAKIIMNSVAAASPQTDLSEVLLRANRKISRMQQRADLRLDHPEELAGASFAIAKISGPHIEILQGADSLAVWQTRDGAYHATPNSHIPHELQEAEIFSALMREHGSRQSAWKLGWNEWIRIYRQCRNIPGECAILNGQPQVERCWTRVIIPTSDIITLILFTDGLVCFEDTFDPHALAERVIKGFRKGGLEYILDSSMERRADKSRESWTDQPEATAIAVQF